MSHSACHNVLDPVVGERLDGPQDIARLAVAVGSASLDLLQADHAWSGIEIALWDLLGRARDAPVHDLLGEGPPVPRTPYASSLFGDEPHDTWAKARAVAGAGYRAAKFGWGPYGLGTGERGLATDADHVMAARDGLGPDAALLVDAGTVWGSDVDAAAARLPALEDAGVTWLEEPFASGALDAYAALARRCARVRLAAGEGAHTPWQARHLVDHGGLGFVQVDTGRIGGIGPAAAVARHARRRGVRFVNHTFTTHLALSASLQPYAASPEDTLCEYPVEQSELARAATLTRLDRGRDGLVRVPDAPGLGVSPDLAALRPYLVDVEITVAGRTLYRTPELVP
jgi:L-alanine-DL-glutamate epimerase-like enolase superfamily enzyme